MIVAIAEYLETLTGDPKTENQARDSVEIGAWRSILGETNQGGRDTWEETTAGSVQKFLCFCGSSLIVGSQ